MALCFLQVLLAPKKNINQNNDLPSPLAVVQRPMADAWAGHAGSR
jgi:hypothetical protein